MTDKAIPTLDGLRRETERLEWVRERERERERESLRKKEPERESYLGVYDLV